MAEGIILAGGLSSRIKTNKMSLSIDGKPLILHTINSMKPFVSKIILVTGKYHDELSSIIGGMDNVQIVYNPDYEKGMFTSIKEGVKCVNDDFFILPGDMPFVAEETFQQLLNSKEDITVPSYHHKDGHPIFLKQHLAKEILLLSDDDNLKQYRNRHSFKSIPVNDPNIVIDIDTIEDYYKVIQERK